MSGRVKWSRVASRNRMRRQGVEDVKGKTPIITEPAKQPRRRLSKAELSEQATAALLAWREGQTLSLHMALSTIYQRCLTALSSMALTSC
jgi:hypothetical protein